MISTPKYRILGLIWLMMLIAYMDRVNIAVAGKTIMADLQLTKTQFGFVLSAFTLGYAVLQAPGGWLADRFGSRKLLIWAILIWSLFTGLTGAAASLVGLVNIRTLFGVGEGIENGAQFKLIGDHFEPQERSRANAIFLTALPLGPLLASPLAVWLLAKEGWRALFWCFAAVGMLAAVLLYIWLPSEMRAILSRESASSSSAPTPAPQAGESTEDARHNSGESLCSPFRVPGTTPLMLAYLLFNIAFWGFIGWMPTYLLEQRHLALGDLGFLGALPYACGFAGLLVLGQLGSGRLVWRRHALVGWSYGVAGVFYLLAAYAPTGRTCVLSLSVAAFFLFGAFGPYWAIVLGLSKSENRGAFSGVVNFGGQVGGFVGQIMVGYLADRMRNFEGAFWFMAAALVAACVITLVSQPGLIPSREDVRNGS